MCCDDLLTAVELANRLNIKPDTIRAWTRAGKIPARRLSYKVVRYNLPIVVQALESKASPKPRRPAGGGR
jgi:excisionase family DNA binding protein